MNRYGFSVRGWCVIASVVTSYSIVGAIVWAVKAVLS